MAAPRKLLHQPDCEPFAWDDLCPRNEEERYRIYRCCNAQLELLATCSAPGGIGVAICQLHEEEEFDSFDCSVGVLDTHGTSEKRGTWIVNPFTAGGTRSG